MRGLPVDEMPEDLEVPVADDWVRPDGPPKVGIQVGHWKNDEVPEELKKLLGNTGASGGGMSESEVVYKIAEEISDALKEKGVVVEILPATVPVNYWADVFISLHADGSEDSSKNGYKFSGPRRDYTGKADDLVSLLEDEYGDATGFERDPNVTRNMRGYYAFSWWRYEHAIHPMTPGVIIETGFLSNYSDRTLLINNPDVPAKAIATALTNFLTNEKLL